ncbi:glutamyl-tRNA synthetase, class Ic [Rhodobacteraceae bacterium HTCC2150]|nr:glutamyl-tRNA synthetase, class Ic [Rhodobacteraceae bacterium HTCC2150]
MRTRFAPSPTGPLHLGHAYSAILGHDLTRKSNGEFLVRIEDIDQDRARPEWEDLIYEDLAWLGLTWDQPVLRQSTNMTAYDAALDHLWNMGVLYPCVCNRRDIREAASAPQGRVNYGPDGIIYPGICRHKPIDIRPKNQSLRLNSECINGDFRFTEMMHTAGQQHFTADSFRHDVGDVVLQRRDMGTSYHLSVVVDDAAQGITDVLRGNDLFDATKIHVVLQTLLNLPTPTYHHHPLINDESGKRLAKRDDARAIRLYREEGKTPAEIRQMIGL